MSKIGSQGFSFTGIMDMNEFELLEKFQGFSLQESDRMEYLYHSPNLLHRLTISSVDQQATTQDSMDVDQVEPTKTTSASDNAQETPANQTPYLYYEAKAKRDHLVS